MTTAAELDIRPFADRATIRLISTAYIDEPALAPLAEAPGDLAALEQIEGLTSARRAFILPLPGGLEPDELLTAAHGYGWTLINAAFCYTRPSGNRFNGPDRGAWYATHGNGAAETARAEVCWHLTSELAAVGVFDNITAYRELVAGFMTRFHDLSGKTGATELDPEPNISYPAGQVLAREILRGGGNGVLYPSARLSGGQCLAAFRPHLVQDIRQGDTWIFKWSGSPEPDVGKG